MNEELVVKTLVLYLLKLYLLSKLLLLANCYHWLVWYSNSLFFVVLEGADLVTLCQLSRVVFVGWKLLQGIELNGWRSTPFSRSRL